MNGRVPREIEAALARAGSRVDPFARPIVHFDTVGSTSDVVARLAADGVPEGLTVTADAQTDGRGRRGRQWFSPTGAGIYTSVLLGPLGDERAGGMEAERLGLLTLTAGVGIAEGIRTSTGLEVELKWPNDLVIDRRKLGGILAEGVALPAGPSRVVLGFGINVQPAAYPRELASKATSLEGELGRPIDRAVVLVECLASLAARYADLKASRFDAILDRWRTLAPSSVGRLVEWQRPDGAISGTTAGIDARGALLLRTRDGVLSIVSGELTWN